MKLLRVGNKKKTKKFISIPQKNNQKPQPGFYQRMAGYSFPQYNTDAHPKI